MPYDPMSKESRLAMKGPVDKLVRDDEVGRLVLFLERADRGDREDPLDAQLLHCEDVRAEVQLRRQQQVSPTVPGKKGHFAPRQIAEHEGVRRLAERGCDALFFDVG